MGFISHDEVVNAAAGAHSERLDLAALLLALGPDAPTLCAGWNAADLAAHLVIRESRPDAALGILGGPLAGWTQHIQGATANLPYNELVAKVRGGPPTLSFFAIPGVDGLANLFEFFVHHEDLRRGQADWQPRELNMDFADLLWGRLAKSSRLLFRKAPVGVVLERTDGMAMTRIVARKGNPAVTLRGSVGELVLRSYGRTEVKVEVDGTADALAAFNNSALGF
ncbi:MAG: TIGR03085 family metal-binding protein [Actinomycetota bacterium]|nr:TIGR03085 family metal-binding protein [Actinomycetota bacterium]